jgi:hypothetical protein
MRPIVHNIVVDMVNILVEDVKEVGLQWGGSSPHT